MIIKDAIKRYDDWKAKAKEENEDSTVTELFEKAVTMKDFVAKNYDPADIAETLNYVIRREEILNLADEIGWDFVSEHLDLPLDFIREFSTRLIWKSVTYNLPYDEDFLNDFATKVDWRILFLKYHFNEAFLYKHQDRIRSAIIKDLTDIREL